MKRVIIRIATLAVFGSSLAVAPTVVNAESFTPQPSAPVVNITSVTSVDAPGGPSDGFNAGTIRPQDPRSADIGRVVVTVTTNATVAILGTVELCFYKGDNLLAMDNCPTAPLNGLKITWTESTQTFATPTVDGSSSRVETSSAADTGGVEYNGAAKSVTLTFDFTLSMAASTGTWKALAVATYDAPVGGGTYPNPKGSDRNTTGLTVAYFGLFSTNVQSTSYGVLDEGDFEKKTGLTVGKYNANEESDYTITATDFSDGADIIALLTTGAFDNAVAKGAGKVAALDCALEANVGFPSYVEGSSLRLTKLPVAFTATLPPTPEAGESRATMECTLRYGSGAVNALNVYSNTITVAIKQKSA
jgi:hypothetical protein